MKIAQIVPCLGNKSGGPSRSVYNLSQSLRDRGVSCDILTCNYLDDRNIVNEDWIKTIEYDHRKPFEYAPGFKKLLNESEYDLIHIHSIYTYPVTIAGFWAKRKKIPYIIAPRGSLYPVALSSSSQKRKRVFNKLVLKPLFSCARVIHATSLEERDIIRGLGFKTPIAVIPNSVPIVKAEKDDTFRPNDDVFRLGYVGRINPIKNLDGLLRAWSKSGLSHNEKAELVIVGGTRLPVEFQYQETLHALEKELDITNIKWTGPLDGEDKVKELKTFSFFILPSHSENFGMVVLEALTQGVPAIASKGTPWDALEKSNSGYWVNNDVDSLSEAINQGFHLPYIKRREMGRNAYVLAEQTFSSEAVSKKLIQLYEWVVNGGEVPEFVYVNY